MILASQSAVARLTGRVVFIIDTNVQGMAHDGVRRLVNVCVDGMHVQNATAVTSFADMRVQATTTTTMTMTMTMTMTTTTALTEYAAILVRVMLTRHLF